MKCLSRVGSIPDWSFVKCPLKIQFEEPIQPWRESKPFWTWLFLNIHFRKTRTDSESDACVFCCARTRRGQKHVRSPWKKKMLPWFWLPPGYPISGTAWVLFLFNSNNSRLLRRGKNSDAFSQLVESFLLTYGDFEHRVLPSSPACFSVSLQTQSALHQDVSPPWPPRLGVRLLTVHRNVSQDRGLCFLQLTTL